MKVEHVDEYLGYLTLEKGLSPRTIVEYKRDLLQYLIWCEANGIMPLEATPKECSRYVQTLPVKGLSKKSIGRVISSIRVFYRWAVLQGYCSIDAAYYLLAPRVSATLPVYLSERECAQLLEYLSRGQGVRDMQRRVMLKLLYYCGLRSQELLELRLGQIELDGLGKAVRIRVIGKRAKERILPIPEPLQGDLAAWMEHRRRLKDRDYARHYKCVEVYIESPMVFPSPVTGGVMEYRSLSKMVIGACKRAGIEKHVTPHKLRHTYATNLLRRGVPIHLISQALGHVDIKTTQIYAHVEQADMENSIHGAHIRPSGRETLPEPLPFN